MGLSLIELRWLLDRVWQAFAVLPYLLGGVALSMRVAARRKIRSCGSS